MDTRIQVETPTGEWFTLIGPGKGDRGVYLGSRVEGVWAAPTETIYNSTAFQIGASYGGERNPKRDVTFDVEIVRTRTSSWERNWSDWVRAWKTDEDCKLWYETDNSRRYLKCRLAKEVGMSPNIDPIQMGHATVTMTLVAADPWWYEEVDTSPYVTTTDTTAGGTEIGHVNLWNSTPLDMWPIWVAQGTAGIVWFLQDWSFGNDDFERAVVDADRVIQLAPLIAGEHLTIDTDPLAEDGQFNSSLDTEFHQRMGGVRFMYQVPPYTGTEDEPIVWPVAVRYAPIGAGIQLRMRRAWPTPMGMQ
jgi:hypothetical protein